MAGKERERLLDLLHGRMCRLEADVLLGVMLELADSTSSYAIDILLREGAHMLEWAKHCEAGGARRGEPCPCCGYNPAHRADADE